MNQTQMIAGLSHNLPAQTVPFIGREVELAQLAALLGDPNIRLVTVLGPGGIGKTRLALEAAAMQLENRSEMLCAFRAEEVEALGSGLDDGLATLVLAIEEAQGVSPQASPTVGADLPFFSLVVAYQRPYIGGTTIWVSDAIQLEVYAPKPQTFVEPPGQRDNFSIEGRVLNTYRFAISGDGYFELTRCQAGRCGYVIYRKRCYSLQLGCGATNRLELVADGCRFTCYVNGARLAEISDRCLSSGSLGVFVETLFSGGIHVGFDNVMVTELDPTVTH